MHVVLARGSLAKLVGNAEVSRSLAERHPEILPEILEEYRAIVATSALELGGGAG